LKILFPEDFADDLSSGALMVRDIAINECRLLKKDLPRIERAKLMKEIEAIKLQLREYTKSNTKTIIETIREMWINYYSLCETLADLDDKMNDMQIRALSTYDFYRKKKRLAEKHRRSPTTD
jgi:hypothetical protein